MTLLIVSNGTSSNYSVAVIRFSTNSRSHPDLRLKLVKAADDATAELVNSVTSFGRLFQFGSGKRKFI